MKNTVKRFGQITTLVIAFLIARCCWKFQPWMEVNHAVHIGSWEAKDQLFQVWQRKNGSFLEPFATGMFVRLDTKNWQVFCLDIQDTYLPDIKLIPSMDHVIVMRGPKMLGRYNTGTATFERLSDENSFYTVIPDLVTEEQPPSKWWVN